VNSLVVTIDGPAAAGKSTTAREVARRLGWLYLDSGALYRALAVRAARRGISPEDAEAIRASLLATDLDVVPTPDGTRVLLDGEDVTSETRGPAVTDLSSRLAAIAAVRERVLAVARRVASRHSVVAEGRDMGTVAFPDATVKIYLDASIEERARRRTHELEARGTKAVLDEVRSDLERRDRRDRERAVAPLTMAPDSLVLDTTSLSSAEQVERVLEIVHARHPEIGPAPTG
jgi:cytidylate kinase